jgi:hypothetical protein
MSSYGIDTMLPSSRFRDATRGISNCSAGDITSQITGPS